MVFSSWGYCLLVKIKKIHKKKLLLEINKKQNLKSEGGFFVSGLFQYTFWQLQFSDHFFFLVFSLTNPKKPLLYLR